MTRDEQLALAPYVSHFALVFAAFFVGATAIILYFKLTNNLGLAAGIVMASAVSAGQKFLHQKKRAFSEDEKLRMTVYSVIAVLLVAFVALLLRAALFFLGIATELGRLKVLMILTPLELVYVQGFLLIALFTLLYLTYGPIINLIYKSMVKRGEV